MVKTGHRISIADCPAVRSRPSRIRDRPVAIVPKGTLGCIGAKSADTADTDTDTAVLGTHCRADGPLAALHYYAPQQRCGGEALNAVATGPVKLL